jgi:hypothetical protein
MLHAVVRHDPLLHDPLLHDPLPHDRVRHDRVSHDMVQDHASELNVRLRPDGRRRWGVEPARGEKK